MLQAAYRDSRRVLECLQKCLKIADLTVQTNSSHVSLFIEILNKYVYYFDQNNTEVTHHKPWTLNPGDRQSEMLGSVRH